MLLVAPLALTACSESIRSVEPPILTDPPEKFILLCDRPVLLPEGDLTQEELEFYWLKDRSHLISCGFQLQALINFYKKRDKGISK